MAFVLVSEDYVKYKKKFKMYGTLFNEYVIIFF